MNGDTPLSAQVVATLGGLGGTASEIAGALEAKGITGRRHSSQHCPLANYLMEQFPEAERASVGIWSMLIDADGGTLASPESPGSCRDFVRAFDNGRFPNLVQP